MRVSQKLDYVLRALTYLAQYGTGAPIPVGEIAGKLNLPRRFLEQQMNVLAKSGLVVCKRGTGGGCLLSREGTEITVEEVVLAVDGTVLDVPHVVGSVVSEMWDDARKALSKELNSVSLADLAARQDRVDATKAPMFYI